MGKAAIVGIGGVVLGLVAGVVIGLTLAEPGGAPVQPAPAARSATAADVDVEAAQSGADAVTPDTPTRRHTGSVAATATAAQLLDSLDVGPLPSGDGSVTGYVRTKEGEPVAGVEMRAVPKPPETWAAEPDPTTPEARVAAYARSVRWRELSGARSMTGEDGSFTLSGLAEQQYTVSARSDGHTIRTADRQSSRVEPGATLDFTATPVTQATFVIRGPDGSAPAEAQIQLKRANHTRTNSWKAGATSMRVDPGPHTLTVTSGEFGELRSQPVEITIEEGRSDQEFTVELGAVPGIGGSLTTLGPSTHQSTEVWLLRTTDGTPPTPGRLVQTGGSEQSYSGSGDDGYLFTDLAPGTYAVGAARWNELPKDVHMVEVSDGFVRQDLVVPDYDRDDCVEIVAIAPDGSPVTEFSCMLRWEHDSGSQGHGITPIVRPDGSVWAPVPRGFDRKTGTHSVVVTSTQFGQVTRTFTPGAGPRVEIRFQEPAVGVVQIAGYAGSGAEGRISVSVGSAGNSWGHEDAGPDAEGRVKIAPATPGPQTVTVRTKDRWGRGTELVSREVTLVSGENTVTVALPALHTLTVELSGEVGGRQVSVVQEGSHGGVPVAPDEHGQAVFDLLPAGEYTIQVYNGEGGNKKVTLPGTTLVRF